MSRHNGGAFPGAATSLAILPALFWAYIAGREAIQAYEQHKILGTVFMGALSLMFLGAAFFLTLWTVCGATDQPPKSAE